MRQVTRRGRVRSGGGFCVVMSTPHMPPCKWQGRCILQALPKLAPTPSLTETVVSREWGRRRSWVPRPCRAALATCLLLAEELAAVPAVVPPFREREAHCAARAAVPTFVLHPVVSGTAARLVTHRPAEDSALTVPDQDPAVIPVGDKGGGWAGGWGGTAVSPGDNAKEANTEPRPKTLLLSGVWVASCQISEDTGTQGFFWLRIKIHRWLCFFFRETASSSG